MAALLVDSGGTTKSAGSVVMTSSSRLQLLDGDVLRGVDVSRGMILDGRFLSHTQTSSIARWIIG